MNPRRRRYLRTTSRPTAVFTGTAGSLACPRTTTRSSPAMPSRTSTMRVQRRHGSRTRRRRAASPSFSTTTTSVRPPTPPTGVPQTVLEDVVRFALPFGPLGRIASKLLLAPHIRRLVHVRYGILRDPRRGRRMAQVGRCLALQLLQFLLSFVELQWLVVTRMRRWTRQHAPAPAHGGTHPCRTQPLLRRSSFRRCR